MLPSSRTQILESLADEAIVLDVGGWASPLARADWVIDLMPYESRDLYGDHDPSPERFTPETWVGDGHLRQGSVAVQRQGVRLRGLLPHTRRRAGSHLGMFQAQLGGKGRVHRSTRARRGADGRRSRSLGGLVAPPLACRHRRGCGLVRPETSSSSRLAGVLGQSGVTRALPPEDLVSTLFWKGSFDYAEKIFFEPEELYATFARKLNAGGRDGRSAR